MRFSRRERFGRHRARAVAGGVDFIHHAAVLDEERVPAQNAPLGQDYAFGAAWRDFHVRRNAVRAARQPGRRRRRNALNSGMVNERCGAVVRRGHWRAERRQRINVVAPRLAIEELHQLFQFFRILGSQIVRLAIVFVEIVKLPRIVFRPPIQPMRRQIPGQ